jgi:lantibiotic biosynthesis protein
VLYAPLPWFYLRSPRLPFSSFPSDAIDTEWNHLSHLIKEPGNRLALAVAAPSLLQALERADTLESKKFLNLQRRILRYLIRMCTRTTPFGLFAGVALGRWDNKTTLEIADPIATVRIRPDMGWLSSVVDILESRLELRSELQLNESGDILCYGGRFFLTTGTTDAPYRGVLSIRATPVVRQVLDAARRPIRYRELVESIISASPRRAPAKVEGLVDQLLKLGFLKSELRPSLTTVSPAGKLVAILQRETKVAEIGEELKACLDSASRWNNVAPEEKLPAYETLSEAFTSLGNRLGVASESPLQLDASMTLTGETLNRKVAREATLAAELLLRLSPVPNGSYPLTLFKRLFISRYGAHTQIPLLEVLDPQIGIGPPAWGESAPSSPFRAQRDEALLNVAAQALIARRHEIVLDDALIDKLQTWRPTVDSAPKSIELNLFVMANSEADIDRGHFTVAVAPNVGAMLAGRALARFTDIVPHAEELLRSEAVKECSDEQESLHVDLTYLPLNPRSANVAIHPPLRSFELSVGVWCERTLNRQIRLSEILVSVVDDRIILRWRKTGQQIKVSCNHMLNPRTAPEPCRFIMAVASDGQPQLNPFDWGTAKVLPALPRVTYGRIVLCTARWRLYASDMDLRSPETLATSFASWRETWDAPSLFYLSSGDNRLLLSAYSAAHRAELYAELRRAGTYGCVLLQEALPGPTDCWLAGPSGRYASELVIPMELKNLKSVRSATKYNGRQQPREHAVIVPPPRTTSEQRWIYAQLAVPKVSELEVMTTKVRSLVESSEIEGSIDRWFFIRYTEPDNHLRLRFRCGDRPSAQSVMRTVSTWSQALLVHGTASRISFHPYRPERERYGGNDAILLAESIFWIDSYTVLDLLEIVRRLSSPSDIALLATTSVHSLLRSLAVTAVEANEWCLGLIKTRPESGALYREVGPSLREIFVEPETLSAHVSPEGCDVLERRERELAVLGSQLWRLENENQLSRPRASIARDLVHMHCNRLLGVEPDAEAKVLGLVTRTVRSLQHWPHTPGNP